MEESKPADAHGGVYDQQADRLPPKAGPSQDANQIQNEHGQDQDPRGRKDDYTECHGPPVSLLSTRPLTGVRSPILPHPT